MENKNNIHQLPFDFAHRPYLGRDDFIKAPCNSEALDLIELWPQWPSFALCIYGPEHCGKTHLTHIFEEIVATKTHSPYPLPRMEAKDINIDIIHLLFDKNKCLVVENINSEINEEALFHLFNLYRDQGGFILFTSNVAPARLSIKLADLSSRLKMIPAIGINEPDDELLSALIIKLFMDRQITVSREIINYILVNMQRSFSYAHKLVEEIDNVSLSYVKEAINSLNQHNQRELF